MKDHIASDLRHNDQSYDRISLVLRTERTLMHYGPLACMTVMSEPCARHRILATSYGDRPCVLKEFHVDSGYEELSISDSPKAIGAATEHTRSSCVVSGDDITEPGNGPRSTGDATEHTKDNNGDDEQAHDQCRTMSAATEHDRKPTKQDFEHDTGLSLGPELGVPHDTHCSVSKEPDPVFKWLGSSASEGSVVDDNVAGVQQIHETEPCDNEGSLRYDTHGYERENEMQPLCYKYHWRWLAFSANLLLNSPGYQKWIRDASGSRDGHVKHDEAESSLDAASTRTGQIPR